MANIVIGVTGGIAAYKAVDLTSKLIQAGHEVRVVLTEATISSIRNPDRPDPLHHQPFQRQDGAMQFAEAAKMPTAS